MIQGCSGRSRLSNISWNRMRASLIVMSHLGRPSEEREPQFSMKQLESHLAEIAGVKVTTAPDCVGSEVEKMASELKAGEILLLENTRYHKR